MKQANLQTCTLGHYLIASRSLSVSSYSPNDSAVSAPIDLSRVRALFALPERVAESAFLRREVAARMHERLELVKIVPGCLLDAGCGDGADLAQLQAHYPDARMLAIDASLALLQKARANHALARSSLNRVLMRLLPRKPAGSGGAELLCGDFAALPIQRNTVDLIWSNLALHWHPQPDRVFAEWRRVLRTDGLLMFSCFGPDTFKELRQAFAQIDDAPHTLSFVDMHDFGDMLVNAGFSTPVMDMETITVTYESVDRLLADVRAWGGNPLLTRRRGLLGRQAWKRMRAALEQARTADGRIRLSYEIVYGHAFRPAPRVTSAGEAIVRIQPRKT